MSPEREPVIYVAIPVWRGEAVVEETLRSLLAQTWPSWRAVISVDGGDEGSAQGCRPFLADPWFSMVVQPDRLGWAGNLNWLMARCDGDYFVYWQQDDLCSSNYLETLVGHTTRHPEAACAFADVQWFGARTELVHSPSVTGGALQRVLTQIETLDYLPFRGLITRRALAGGGPLRLATRKQPSKISCGTCSLRVKVNCTRWLGRCTSSARTPPTPMAPGCAGPRNVDAPHGWSAQWACSRPRCQPSNGRPGRVCWRRWWIGSRWPGPGGRSFTTPPPRGRQR